MAGPAGEAFLAGEYTITWNAVALGVMEGDQGVPTVYQQNKAEQVQSTSKYGKSTVEAFYLGGDWFAQFMALEAGKNLGAFWPFGAFGVQGVVARSFPAMAAALGLTAIAGTPASGSPATLTANKAILAPGWQSQLAYGPTLRKVSIKQQLFPNDLGGGVIGWLSTT